MVLRDQPESNPLPLPQDNLSVQERLNRLFCGIEDRWRLMAVLTLNSGPSNLMKRELVQLAENYGPSGLAVRLIFVGSDNVEILERELEHWKDEHIVATGDNIHARRFLNPQEDYLPCLKLYAPDGLEEMTTCGFDTEVGLDLLCRRLEKAIKEKCTRKSEEEKKPVSVQTDRHL